MERRAKGVVIVPQEGESFDELQANSRQAFRARADYLNKIRLDTVGFLSKSEEVNRALREEFPDIYGGVPEPKPIGPEVYKRAIVERIVERSGFTPGRKYNLDMTDRLEAERKAEIFRLSVKRLREMAAGVDVELPSNLGDRVRIIDEESYWSLLLWQDGVNEFGSYDSLGATFRNRLAVINEGAINEKIADKGWGFDDLVRYVGVHEIWHTIEYSEDWDLDKAQITLGENWNEIYARRRGLATKSPNSNDHRELHSLTEGVAELLTKMALEADGYPFFGLNTSELRVVDELRNVVGIEPLLRATLTKSGFREFATLVNQIYGKGAMRRLCEALKIDRGAKFFGSMIDEETGFRVTLNFLETGKVEIPED